MESLLNYDAAAKWFTSKGISCSPLTLRRWVSRRQVPHVKLRGGRVFFDPATLEKFLADQAVPVKAATA